MVPLYIKGFLPQQNGSSIMLPAEITTLSGADFDIDKLYIMLPEFRVIPKYDRKRFINDLIVKLLQGKSVSPEILKEYHYSLNKAIEDGKKAPEGSEEYKLWMTYKINREKYRIAAEDKIEKIEYDFSKSPQENGLKARNNLLIDMMWGVLTNPDTASKMLNPGGFDNLKKVARIISILRSGREAELKRLLNITDNQTILSKLRSLDLEQLNELTKEFNVKLDPLNPITQVQLHQQNMTGAALIGVYANHNANHALMQHTKLGISVKEGSFVLNGKRLTSLHSMLSDNRNFISKNNASFLAASVDNVKDPVLALLNQNLFTADASMLLSRAGYDPIEIGLIMSQPIVLDITSTYFKERRDGKGKDAIIDDVIDKYRKKAEIMDEVTYSNYASEDFSIDNLADNIILHKEVEELNNRSQTSDYRKVEFYKKQVSVGFLFKRILTTADALGQLVLATRSDTQKGAAGPTIAALFSTVQKTYDFLEETKNEGFPLVNADIIKMGLLQDTDNTESIREKLLDSPLPWLQAFFTLGVEQAQNMLSSYFPQFTPSFQRVINGEVGLKGLKEYTKTGKLRTKTLNSIYNDLLAYIMSKTEFFGSEVDRSSLDENGNPVKIITSTEKRRDFISNFPTYFEKVIAENKDIADLGFIRRLRIVKANKKNPVDTLVFRNVGRLSPILKENYMRDWQSLLYMGPEAQMLALNLFRYSFYRNGFAFGPNTFIHLAPTAVRQAIPEYIETLRGLLESEDDYSQFIDQYIYNHLDDRSFVPEIPQEASTPFTNERKEALDIVRITIDTESNSGDKKAVRRIQGVGEEATYDFFNYIARSYKGGTIYYRLVQDDNAQSNTATYERIEPLGFKNSFIEYEYGKDASEIESVINRDSKDTNSLGEEALIASEPSIDYESIPEYADFKLPVDEDYLEAVSSQEAFQEVYGTKPDITPVQSGKLDLSSVEPNLDYRDTEDNGFCLILGEL